MICWLAGMSAPVESGAPSHLTDEELAQEARALALEVADTVSQGCGPSDEEFDTYLQHLDQEIAACDRLLRLTDH